MATPAERKALLFFGIIAVLGATVRVWRAHRPGTPVGAEAADTYSATHSATYSAGSSRYADAHSALSLRSRRSSDSRQTAGKGARAGSRSHPINRDSDAVVDLDRASISEIDALGVLPRGMARLIVADRDSFGPFGSLDELRRVPFLSTSTLRKLAPRVTFSLVPRPRNTVVHPRALPAITSARRKARGQP
jgi:helix-hairpin-helix protein